MTPGQTRTELPKAIGPYRIVRLLGEGGMGRVYEAVREGSGARLAVKTVSRENLRLLAALRAEVLALKHVRHPGVIRIVEEGLSEATPWYAMELIEGQTLAQFNRSLWSLHLPEEVPSTTTTDAIPSPASSSSTPALGGLDVVAAGARMPAAAGRLQDVLNVYRALCAPLSEIHAQALVHRDLKPSNIILRDDGSPVIMDFGLAARALGVMSRDKLEVFDRLLGSVPYIAPEQVRREFVDARADLYSIGCMLFESLTGRRPFRGTTVDELLNAHETAQPPAPSELVDGVPPALDVLVVSLLAKRPIDRLGHADDVAEALDAIGPIGGRPVGRAAKISRLPYLYRPDLVGRTEVMDNLRLRREAATRGQGGLVLVQGESGIGKTFLAAQLGREAVLEKLQLVTAECFSVAASGFDGEARAGHLHLFRPLLRLVHDHCREGGLGACEKLLGTSGKVLAAHEPMLRDLPGQDLLPDPPPLPPEPAQQRLFSALGDVIGRFARERPLMMIFDDLQWADELSLAFLASLPPSYFGTTPLLCLGLYRSGEGSQALSQLASRAYVTSASLGRLSVTDLERVIGGLLAMPRPPRWLTDFIHRHSEGNPFIASEYLRLAAAEGLLQRRAGRWAVSEQLTGDRVTAPFPVPGSIRELVAVRLHGLTERDRLVLDAAAVLGREFEDGVLGAVVALREDEIADAVRELVNRQVFERSSVNRHRFVHDKLREVAYDQLTPRRRPALHGAAATVIEERYAATLDEHWSELAYHFKAADDRVKATLHMERAADQARARFANREAQRFYSELLAWGLVADGAEARHGHWEHHLGEALHAQGELQEARRHLETAVALLGHPFPGGKVGLAVSTNGQLARQVVNRMGRGAAPAVRTVDAHRSVAASRAYDRLLQIFYYGGLEQQMFYATLRTLNLAERGGPTPELARAYSIAHAVAGVIPVRSLADRYLGLARKTLRAAYDAEVDSYLQLLAGVYRTGTAEWTQAREALDRGLDLAKELGFERRADEIRLGLANWSFLRGNYGDVRRHLEQGRPSLREDPQAQAWRQLMRAQVALVQGANDEAAELARSLLEVESRLARSETTWMHAVLGAALLRAGSTAAAVAHVDKALAGIVAGRPLAFYCVEAYALTCEALVALAAEREPAVVTKAQKACAALGAFARVFPAAQPRALRLEGDLAVARGRGAAATRAWRRSNALAQKLDMKPDEAEAAWRLGRALGPTSRDREAHLAQALGIAEALGFAKLTNDIAMQKDHPRQGDAR